MDVGQVRERWLTAVGMLRAGAIEGDEQRDLVPVERSPRLRLPCPEPVEGAFQVAHPDGVVVLDPHLRAVDG